MSTRKILLLLQVSLLLSGCAKTVSPNQTPTLAPRRIIAIENRLTAAERLEIFNTVWQTVNDRYFDPTFGGVDWRAIGDEYRQKLTAVKEDYTFWLEVLNPMLFELGVSHLVALPAELSKQVDMMTFSTGALGLDVRLLDGKPVVTRVVAGFPADKAGLRPGFVVTAVNGWTQEDFAAAAIQTPPDNERNRRGNLVGDMRSMLYGATGKQVVVEYLDANDRPQNTTLQYAQRKGTCDSLDPSLPPACADFEVKRLANGIGYINFSGFLPPVLDSVLKAIDDLHDVPALIIDLRGNPGGVFPVRKAIASKLVGEPKLFIRYQYRDGQEEAYLDPVSDPYPGEVVILVDELSASSSEEFAGSLQALGRAVIVGSQTPGRCLTANFAPLPNGGLLVYPFGQSQTPGGRILENNGVVPDIEVALDRHVLLLGIDAQLEAAIEYAKSHVKK